MDDLVKVGKLYVFQTTLTVFLTRPYDSLKGIDTKRGTIFMVLALDPIPKSYTHEFIYTEILLEDNIGWLVLDATPTTKEFPEFKMPDYETSLEKMRLSCP